MQGPAGHAYAISSRSTIADQKTKSKRPGSSDACLCQCRSAPTCEEGTGVSGVAWVSVACPAGLPPLGAPGGRVAANRPPCDVSKKKSKSLESPACPVH
eukprot:scaffold25294_cov133-Isochrysis_galbana.AAC.1